MQITPEEKLLEYANDIDLIKADFDVPKETIIVYFNQDSDTNPKRFFDFCRKQGIRLRRN